MTLGAGDVAALLRRHGIVLRKALGQHFVVDPNTVRRIARLAGVGPGDRVLEIGPGAGTLTLALAETGAHVTAVEIDGALLPLLEEVTDGLDVDVVHADARRVDWAELLVEPGWVLVANLPYNVGTPLVMDLLLDVELVERMLVMVQREVADRFVAPPGHRSRGALSVKVEARAEATVAGSVPSTVFLPPPDVESALVDLRRRPHPALADDPGGSLLAEVDRLAASAFRQRRKMLRRSLGGLLDVAAIRSAGVDPAARPETLGIAEWVALARART